MHQGLWNGFYATQGKYLQKTSTYTQVGKKMGKEGRNCELSSDLNFVSHQTPLNNFDETSKRKTLS